ncbi:hypothetical protein XI08_11455 [Bradyrhizobium sp. CCBAU 11361]|nr:hypothetical protein [Bradyrhizobium sp. CCBAU 11361]
MSRQDELVLGQRPFWVNRVGRALGHVRVSLLRRAAGVVSASAGGIPASNDVAGRFLTCYLRRREYCQVPSVPCELICGDLAIADGGQFAAQELNWRAVLRRRKLKVDNSDPCTLLQGGREIVEEGIGLSYLVIHVHKDCGIQRGSGQTRVVWFAERELHVRQLQKFCSPGELYEIIPRDVLGNDRAAGCDEVRESDRVVATACTNVADCHARFQFKNACDLARLIESVAVLFRGAA